MEKNKKGLCVHLYFILNLKIIGLVGELGIELQIPIVPIYQMKNVLCDSAGHTQRKNGNL